MYKTKELKFLTALVIHLAVAGPRSRNQLFHAHQGRPRQPDNLGVIIQEYCNILTVVMFMMCWGKAEYLPVRDVPNVLDILALLGY